MTNVV